MNITRAILKLRIEYARRFKISPFAINGGMCMNFAADIAKMGFGEDVWGDDLTIEYWSEEIQAFCDNMDFAGYFSSIHCFIMYDEKFYDSECPQGCNYPDDLPCYRRNIDLLYGSEV